MRFTPIFKGKGTGAHKRLCRGGESQAETLSAGRQAEMRLGKRGGRASHVERQLRPSFMAPEAQGHSISKWQS